MKGRQDSHMAVNFSHSGFCSANGFQFFKVHSRRGGEELVRCVSDGLFNDGRFAASRHADTAQLQEVVSSDTSTGDKNKIGQKPHVYRSNVSQHPWISRCKANIGVVYKPGKHDSIDAAFFSARHLRHQHVVKQFLHLIFFLLAHVGLSQRSQLEFKAGRGCVKFGQNDSLQGMSSLFD